MNIANLDSVLHASLAIYHLISNVPLWNNIIVKYPELPEKQANEDGVSMFQLVLDSVIWINN